MAQQSAPLKESALQVPTTSWKKNLEYILEQIALGVRGCTPLSEFEGKQFEKKYFQELLNEHRKIISVVKRDSVNNLNKEKFIGAEVAKYGHLIKVFKEDNKDLLSIGLNPEILKSDTVPTPTICEPACSNLGFQDGTMNHWIACGSQTYGPGQFVEYKILYGHVNDNHIMKGDCFGPTGNYTKAADSYGYIPTTAGPDYQVRIMNPGTDHIDPTVPTVYPGFTHSVMLGDSSEVGCGAAIIQQRFNVTESNAAFTYMYASFIENPGHAYSAQPWFKVTFLDQNGDTIPGCGNNLIVGGPNNPGFYPMSEIKIWEWADTCYIKPWTCVFVSLRKYIGTCVTVIFATGDCFLSAHFSYAYIDAQCDSLVISQKGNCKAKTLTGPQSCGIASYQWFGPCISGPSTGSSITVTCDGIYKLVLTSKAGGCSDTLVDTVKFGVSSMFPSIVGKNLKCPGDKSGSVTASLGGSLSDFNYSWSPGLGNTLTPTGLTAGTYSIKISSNSGCGDSTLSVTLTEPPPLAHTPSATSATCGKQDGAVSVVESGGTAPYFYSWSTGVTTSSLTNLKSGTYSVSVSDANGCTESFPVTVPGGGAFTALPAFSNVICYGGADGTAAVNASSGTPPYTFQWLNGGPSSSTYTGLTAGTYTCVVNDKSNICADTIVVILTQPPLLKITAAGAPVTCFGSCDGQANIIPAGGTTPYTYSWSNGSLNASLSSICKGSYIVTITDKNNCTHDTTIIISEPPPLTFATTSNPSTCNQVNGTASVTPAGGTPPYTYLWNTKATTSNLSNINTGSYTVTVSDSKGCTDFVQIQVPTILPEVFSMSPNAQLLCHGDQNGSLSVDVSGSGAPYSYLWNDGQTTNSITHLAKGTYSVTIKDVNGCTGTVTGTVVEPAPLLLLADQKEICAGQTATLTTSASGGTGPYSYLWNNSSGTSTFTDSPLTTGTYTVETMDANGCKISQIDTIKVNPVPVSVFKGIDVCVGIPTLFTDSSYAKGSGINSWLWDFGDNTTDDSKNPIHTYSKPGTYTVSLKVAVGPCTSSQTHTVKVYPTPVADFSASPQPASVVDPNITFKDLSIGGQKGNWYFGDSKDTIYLPDMNPTHTYVTENIPGGETFTIKLAIVNQYGCPAEVQKTIYFEPEWTFYVPNAFSPNGDEKNEGFYGTGIGIVEKEMWIFDRWGLLIFHTTDLNGAWDGKVQNGGSEELVQQDVYVWMIKIKEVFGKQHRYLGHVTVVR